MRDRAGRDGVLHLDLPRLLAGASDRVFIYIGVSYESQIFVYRVLIWVAPIVSLLVTKRLCTELRDRDLISSTGSGPSAASPPFGPLP